MPRPLRIEYENAYYHVMNRGRRHEDIFHSKAYYRTFISVLSEAHRRFGIQILCYCLMPNHYHLLVKTPRANLGRVMRHINGVYTQRYNRLKKTDGPLFRGRYKAIVIEKDSYQLQVSRYIHLNPLEANLVEKLSDYPWSSYPYYIRKRKTPQWLFPEEVLQQLGVAEQRQKAKYRAFVESGVDEEIQQFYDKGKMTSYLGSDEFREWVYQQRKTNDADISEREKFQFKMNMDKIIHEVAQLFNVPVAKVLRVRRGDPNIPRAVAMYLCQEIADHRLIDIAHKFGLKRSGSIPGTIKRIKKLIASDQELKQKLEQYFT